MNRILKMCLALAINFCIHCNCQEELEFAPTTSSSFNETNKTAWQETLDNLEKSCQSRVQAQKDVCNINLVQRTAFADSECRKNASTLNQECDQRISSQNKSSAILLTSCQNEKSNSNAKEAQCRLDLTSEKKQAQEKLNSALEDSKNKTLAIHLDIKEMEQRLVQCKTEKNAAVLEKEKLDANSKEKLIAAAASCAKNLKVAAGKMELKNSQATKAINKVKKSLKSCEQEKAKYKKELAEVMNLKEKKVLKPTKSLTLPNHEKKFVLTTGTYFLSSEKVSWFIASQRCREAGMNLVSIESNAENSALAKAFKGTSYKGIWSSGTDLGSEGKFYWSATGKPFDQNLTSWWPEQPDNQLGNQDCVYIWFNSSSAQSSLMPSNEFLWNDFQCNFLNRYLCEL